MECKISKRLSAWNEWNLGIMRTAYRFLLWFPLMVGAVFKDCVYPLGLNSWKKMHGCVFLVRRALSQMSVSTIRIKVILWLLYHEPQWTHGPRFNRLWVPIDALHVFPINHFCLWIRFPSPPSVVFVFGFGLRLTFLLYMITMMVTYLIC